MTTKQATHTPGPWTVRLGRGASPRLNVQTEAGYQVASTPTVDGYPAENAARLADATLIAAAPDMLAALLAIEQAIAVSGFADPARISDFIVAEARSAIAKAEGGAS